MGVVVKISVKDKPATIRKELKKFTATRGKAKKKIADYYGALKRGIDGLEYQREMRHED